MATPVQKTSTITAKGQTTVPKIVREALGVDRGGRVAFRVEGDIVTLHRVESESESGDEVIGAFLSFLAADMRDRPEQIRALSPSLAARLEDLAGQGEVDLHAPIHGDVAL